MAALPAQREASSLNVARPSPCEVAIGMRWAGLEVDALFGNFRGENFDRDSERLIIVGHKPA